MVAAYQMLIRMAMELRTVMTYVQMIPTRLRPVSVVAVCQMLIPTVMENLTAWIYVQMIPTRLRQATVVVETLKQRIVETVMATAYPTDKMVALQIQTRTLQESAVVGRQI